MVEEGKFEAADDRDSNKCDNDSDKFWAQKLNQNKILR